MIVLVRIQDWEAKLAQYANSWRNVEYAYGSADCARFAHGAVLAITDTDVLPGLNWPNGWLGTAKFMIRKGWSSVEDPIRQLLPEMEVSETRPGDIVSYQVGGEPHLAVRAGDTALTPAAKGLMIVERKQWRAAWAVG